KLGTGTLTLSAANNYSGGTTLTAGTLVIGNNAALGSGTLAMAAGTTLSFVSGTNHAIANNITISGDPTYTPPAGTTQTIGGVIADGATPGDIVVAGAGTLALTKTNTYTGSTTINSGATLALQGPGSISTSSAVTANGTFDISASTVFANRITTLAGSGTVQLGGNNLVITAGSTEFSGSIQDGGNFGG